MTQLTLQSDIEKVIKEQVEAAFAAKKIGEYNGDLALVTAANLVIEDATTFLQSSRIFDRTLNS